MAQLYAMRLLLDGVIERLEELEHQPDLAAGVDTGGTCPHPPEKQVNATTLGGVPQVLCLVCGEQRFGMAPE